MSPNISRQFGGVATVWIKKILRTLYASIVLRMSLALVIACLVTTILLLAINQYSLTQNRVFWKENSDEIQAFAYQVEDLIQSESLTFKQATEYRLPALELDLPVTISFYSNYGDIFEEIDYLYELEMVREGYFFEFIFTDGIGFMVVYSEEIETQTDLLMLLSFIAGIVLFFLLSLYLILKKLSYITVIEKGINHISHGDMQYKIPLQGSNELTRLAGSINEMGDRLYQNMEQERKSEINQRLLITNMSHDLKTPLTSMTGYIDVIASKLSPDHEVYPLVSTAKKNGQRLEKLIADLFLYSKLISQDVPIHLQSINLNLMLKQMIEIRTEQVVLREGTSNVMASIDPEQFHRVLDNLISNAVKYGVEGAPIFVLVDSREDQVVIEVKNRTYEDLEGDLERLTGRLYTAHEDRNNGSSGLGLSIVTELLKAMDGRLTLSFENKTFTATILLPKA